MDLLSLWYGLIDVLATADDFLSNLKWVHVHSWKIGWAGSTWHRNSNASYTKSVNHSAFGPDASLEKSPIKATGVGSLQLTYNPRTPKHFLKVLVWKVIMANSMPATLLFRPRSPRSSSSSPLTQSASQPASALCFRMASICLVCIAPRLVPFRYSRGKVRAVKCLVLWSSSRFKNTWRQVSVYATTSKNAQELSLS